MENQQQREMETCFKNLIHLDHAPFPFTDAFSQFALTFEPGRALGPAMIEPRSVAMSAQPSDCTFCMFVREAGQLVPVMRQGIEHLPWAVTERAALGSLAVTATTIFTAPRQAVHEITLQNTGDAAIECEPVWLANCNGDRWGPGKKALDIYGLDAQPLRTAKVDCEGGQVTACLDAENGVLPGPGFQIVTSGDLSLEAHCSLVPAWSDCADLQKSCSIDQAQSISIAWTASSVTIAPQASIHVRAVINFSVTNYACRDRHWLDAPTAPFSSLLASVQQRFAEQVNWDKKPATLGLGHQAKAWRARWALLRSGYQADEHGGEYGRAIASTCVCNHWGFTRNFFWDGLFTAAAVARFNPQFAQGCIQSVFSRQDPTTGFCPEHSFNYDVQAKSSIGEPQAPVASWAVERYLQAHDDEAFLRDIYDRLMINHRHWLERGDRDNDGLAEWTWAGQTADDSPLWDEFTGGGIGYLPPVASVQLNAFLYRDALTIAGFADRLGKKADADLLRSSAAKRQQAFMDICYLPDEHLFFDYNHATGRHTRIKTFYLFWPLWAGMDVPETTKRHLIENVLLDPEQFFGPIPFPSVAYNEPRYTSGGYWRGKTWPHISYWLIEMLQQQGYDEAAAQAAKRVCANWCADPSFPENHDTAAWKWEAQSSPDYNWGIALASLLLE